MIHHIVALRAKGPTLTGRLFRGVVSAVALSICLAGQTGCGFREIVVDSALLEQGIFVYNSRAVKDSALTVSPDGEVRPKDHLRFGDLQSYPQERFRGRLARSGGSVGAGPGASRVDGIRVMDREEFHAVGRSARGLADDSAGTFGEAVERTGSLVIFVHGFNTSARSAAEETVSLLGELNRQGLEGPILFYSWPTVKATAQVVVGEAVRKATLGTADALINDVYLNDRKNIDLAAHSLTLWLEELRHYHPKLEIQMIGHSMGSEVVMKALYLWHYKRLREGDRPPGEFKSVDRVVLVGADISEDLFQILAEPCGASAERILVYVNPRDTILEEARELTRLPRVGATAPFDSEGLPGLNEQFNFVELRNPRLFRSVNPVKSLRLQHNPLRHPQVLQHACHFLRGGKVGVERGQWAIRRLRGDKFRQSEAGYYEMTLQRAPLAGQLPAD